MSNDVFNGTSGNDTFNGGDGTDTVTFAGNAAGYRIELVDGLVKVVDIDSSNGDTGTDTLSSIETLSFADRSYVVAPPDILVNTETDNDQFSPSIASLVGGGYIVTWNSYLQDSDGDDYGIYAQRYDNNGNKVGSETLINTTTADDQQIPAVTGLQDGGYVITWSSLDPIGDDREFNVYAQRFDSNGNTVGNETIINTPGEVYETVTSIIALTDGGYLIAWDTSNDVIENCVYLQRYDNAGNKIGSETAIHPPIASSEQNRPVMTALPDSGYVVAWQVRNYSPSESDIYLQRFDSNGDADGSATIVTSMIDGIHVAPDITTLEDGGYVLTWSSTAPDDDATDVYAQRYDSSGSPMGTATLVNTSTASGQHSTTIAPLNDGGYVIAWVSNEQDGDSYGIYAQRFDSNGNKAGIEAPINVTTAGEQSQPDITSLPDGSYVISWTSHGQDGSNHGVYAQRFNADGTVWKPSAINVTGTATADVINAGAGTQLLEGLDGADTLTGGDGDDTLEGGDGDDTLDGGTGADTMYGGMGHDIYVVDNVDDAVVESGVIASPVVISTSPTGVPADLLSDWPELSANGRYVVFQSEATNLVAGDTNSQIDIFIKDLQTGTVERVSTTASGEEATRGSSYGHVSADGRYVVFQSPSSNFLDVDPMSSSDNLFIKDLETGTLQLVSDSYWNNIGNGSSDNADIFPGGNYIVFESYASNLVDGDTNFDLDIFLKRMSDGGIWRMSTAADGTEGNAGSTGAQLTADGQYVLFESSASNLVADDTNGQTDIFKKKLTGEIELLTTNSEGEAANGSSGRFQLSSDSQYLLFQSSADNLVEGDTNGAIDIFIKNLHTDEVQRISMDASGSGEANGASYMARFSDDARFVVFESSASNLVADDTNGVSDVFIKDMQTGDIRRLSVNRDGVEGNGHSSYAQISADGRTIMFGSLATNLGTIDTDSDQNLFAVSNPFLDGGNDTVNASLGGIDTVRSSISYTLGTNVENLVLSGSANLDGTGNSLNNALTGNSRNNVLTGDTGNDTLDGSTGTDTLVGGSGNDTYILADADTIIEDADAGSDTVKVAFTYTLGANLEHLVLTGSGNFNATGNALNNVLIGNSGNNTLSGGTGNDTLKGGAGNDIYIIADADTIIEGSGAGIDHVKASITHTLSSNIENLTLTGTSTINGTGNSLANTISGNSGNNILDGKTGKDTLKGGGGNDTYIVADADTIAESASAGTDLVKASIAYTLGSNLENLTLTGSSAISGTGNTLANLIVGNAANNLINGKAGNDTLTGGAGKDIFRFDTTLSASTNKDTIKDYSAASDTLQLDNAIFKKLTATGTLKAANFKASTSGNAADKDDFILYETDTGKLFYDADGSGSGSKVQFALVGTSTHPGLSATEFVVV